MNQYVAEAFDRFGQDAEGLLGKLDALYCFGSAAYADFHKGYSDLDFFMVAGRALTQDDFDAFHALRERYRRGDDPYLRVLEGECISRAAVRNDLTAPVIYWGSSRDRLNDRWGLRSFSLRGLLTHGVLIRGQDLRSELPAPTRADMLADVRRLIADARVYGARPSESVHAADWLFTICQSLYYLRTGELTAKTAAARWVIVNEPITFRISLERAMEIRQDPALGGMRSCQVFLSSLAPVTLAACDALERACREAETAETPPSGRS